MSEFDSEQDHNLFNDDSNNHSDNHVNVTHVHNIIPTANADYYSKVEEKTVPESISTSNSSDCTAKAANLQLHNQESPYAQCKPMEPC